MFKIRKFCMLNTLHLCVLYGSRNKQQRLPYTALTDWFLQPKWRVFTARYALSPYITQIRFVFKGLNHIRHLLALVGARHIVHVRRIKVKGLIMYVRYIMFILTCFQQNKFNETPVIQNVTLFNKYSDEFRRSSSPSSGNAFLTVKFFDTSNGYKQFSTQMLQNRSLHMDAPFEDSADESRKRRSIS